MNMHWVNDVWMTLAWVSLLNLLALMFFYWLLQKQELSEAHMRTSDEKQRGLSQQISALQGQLLVSNQRITALESHSEAQQQSLEQTKQQILTGSGSALGEAHRMLEQGADVQAVAKESGLSSAEVELMRLVNSLDQKITP